MAHAEKYNRDSVTVDRQKKTVDVIIPTYRPDREFEKLLHRLEEQEYRPDRILVMNTGEQYWNREWEKCPLLEVHHLEQKDFETEKIIQFAKDNFGGYRGDASDRVIDEILLQEE